MIKIMMRFQAGGNKLRSEVAYGKHTHTIIFSNRMILHKYRYTIIDTLHTISQQWEVNRPKCTLRQMHSTENIYWA